MTFSVIDDIVMTLDVVPVVQDRRWRRADLGTADGLPIDRKEVASCVFS
jgi:hypothetical protein